MRRHCMYRRCASTDTKYSLRTFNVRASASRACIRVTEKALYTVTLVVVGARQVLVCGVDGRGLTISEEDRKVSDIGG